MDRHLDDSTTQITVVIVTNNSAGVIADFLSLPDGFEGADRAETIIVDNASQDETLSVVGDLVPEATVIRMQRNAG